MKKIIFTTILVLQYVLLNAQCNIKLIAIDSTLCFNGSTSISAFNNSTSALTPPSGYCNCAANNGNNADIINFKLGSINNSTTCSTPLNGTQGIGSGTASSYANFANVIAPQSISAGGTYSFSTSVSSCAGQVNNTFYLYIDYNRDGDFADTLELVYTQANVLTPVIIINNFTVPPTVVSGPTRIRAIIEEGIPTILNGCGSYTSGETEDYMVNLQNDATLYTWSPSTGLNITSGTNVIANPTSTTTYTVTAVNSFGCNTTTTITVAVANSALSTASSTITNVNCAGASNGSATLNVLGGTSPYSYSWLPSGITTGTISNQLAGTYYVNITDAFGCSISDSITITQPTPINPIVNVTNSLCFAPANGTINISTSGGQSPYTYNWSPNVSNNNSASNLAGGTYSITITDALNCTMQITRTVQSPILLSSTIAIQTGMATAFVGGGVPPYTYNWSPGNLTTQTINAAGEFTCTVTDANGCKDVKEINIPAPLSMSENNADPIKIVANNSGIEVSGNNISKIEIFNSLGQQIASRTKTEKVNRFTLPINTQIFIVRVITTDGLIHIWKR